MRSGHLFWAKNRQKGEVIDTQGLFNNYWSSDEREFLVSGQSWSPTSQLIADIGAGNVVIGKHHCSLVFHFSADTAVRLLQTSIQTDQ